MSKNTNLNGAKSKKDDEFYTPLFDIAEELKWYEPVFEGKTILCNCDDPRSSNFFHYFSCCFERLKLKRLITTCYKSQDSVGFSKSEDSKAIWLEYLGDKNGNHIPDPEEIGINYFEGDGDFRSPECIELLKQADIVVTNPPFSLFREYLSQLMEYDKKFIILGPVNAIAYKEIFPYIKENRLWIGRRGLNVRMPLIRPDDSDTYDEIKNGKKIKVLGNVCWFTNIKYKGMGCNPLPLFRSYSPEAYPKYDNYDAINVDKVADIPIDYPGAMGVPLTFIDKYDPERFEIIGLDRYVTDNPNPGHRFTLAGIEKYARIVIRNKHPEEVNYNFTRP